MIQKLCAQYCQLIGKSGCYLGLADLAMLSIEHNKQVMVLLLGDEDPELKSLKLMLPSPVAGMETHADSPDISSHGTWCFAFCSCDFKPHQLHQWGLRGHFLPLFPRELELFHWDREVADLQSKLQHRVQKLEAKVASMKDDSSEDESAVSDVSIQLTSALQKQKLFQALLRMNLFPADVPGDGDCCLWSIHCLQNGIFRFPKVAPSSASVVELRKAGFLWFLPWFFLCACWCNFYFFVMTGGRLHHFVDHGAVQLQELVLLWQKHSYNVQWQTLFLGLSLHEEVPEKIRNAIKLEAERLERQKHPLEPQTPPRQGKKSKSSYVGSTDTPEKPGMLATRVGGCAPTSFGQPLAQDTILKPPSRKRKSAPNKDLEQPSGQKPKPSPDEPLDGHLEQPSGQKPEPNPDESLEIKDVQAGDEEDDCFLR